MKGQPEVRESPVPVDSDEVAVVLCIYGEQLEPTEVSRILQREPTASHRLGDEAPRGKKYLGGAWFIEQRSFEPIDINQMILGVFEGLPRELEVWRSLSAQYSLRFDIAVHTESGCNFALNPAVVTLIERTGAILFLDIYSYGN